MCHVSSRSPGMCIEALIREKTELTNRLNYQLIEEFKDKSLKEILSSPKPEYLSSGGLQQKPGKDSDNQSDIKRILIKETQIRKADHEIQLSHFTDLSTYFGNVMKERAAQNDATKRITKLLTEVSVRITKRRREFACQLIGVGSIHDGSKIRRCDEIDFVLLSEYQPNDDYEINFVKFSDNLDMTDPPPNILCYIRPKKNSSLQAICARDGMLDDEEQLNIKYRQLFVDLLRSVLTEVCKEFNAEFGGLNKPHFSGFRQNGPALTLKIDGVSVDLTLAFRASPEDMIPHLADFANPELLKYTESIIPDYTELGLIVLLSGGGCSLSTSWIETRLFKSSKILQEALVVCKFYKEVYFDLEWPCLETFYRYLADRIQDEVRQVLLTQQDPRADVSAMFDWIADNDLHHFTMLYRAFTTIPEAKGDRRAAALSYGQGMCHVAITDLISRGVYPSLAKLVDEDEKLAASTSSFAFKVIILQRWSAKKAADALVVDVLETYLKLIASGPASIQHPLLGHSVGLLKVAKLRYYGPLGIKRLHYENIRQIIKQILGAYFSLLPIEPKVVIDVSREVNASCALEQPIKDIHYHANGELVVVTQQCLLRYDEEGRVMAKQQSPLVTGLDCCEFCNVPFDLYRHCNNVGRSGKDNTNGEVMRCKASPELSPEVSVVDCENNIICAYAYGQGVRVYSPTLDLKEEMTFEGGTFAIKCYDCTYKKLDGIVIGGSSDGCQDPFVDDRRVMIVDCDVGSCYKQSIKGEDYAFQRSCIENCQNVENSDVTYSCCNSDLCNHGNHLTYNVAALVTILLATALY